MTRLLVLESDTIVCEDCHLELDESHWNAIHCESLNPLARCSMCEPEEGFTYPTNTMDSGITPPDPYLIQDNLS